MDRTYAVIGTKVILRGHSRDPDLGRRYQNKKAYIHRLDNYDHRWCFVKFYDKEEGWWWPIQDMILATDEPLLRD